MGSSDNALMTDTLEIRLLGPLQVGAHGRPVDVNGPKRQALVAVLALHTDRVVAVDALIEALWDEDLPAAPRNAVQHHVTRLRTALGPDAIVAGPEGYALKRATVDALRFEKLLAVGRGALRHGDARAAADTLARALALWRGSALHGLSETEWGSTEARRLEALRTDALEDGFEAALALGEHNEVVPAIRAALDENPFRERLWGQLMLALYRGGRQADALGTFQQARAVLSERLGLEPGPELQRIQRAILAHDPLIAAAVAVAARRRGNLPAPVNSFVGRREALVEIEQLVREHRLVTLTGPPGVGKSRLAFEVAHSLENDFPGGIWLVDLTHAGSEADVERVAAQVIDVQGPARNRDALARVVAGLRDVDALLVLDDCSRVVEETARLAATVLAECPGVRVLATSREVLPLAGEVRVNVAPLAVPDPGVAEVRELAGCEAVQLFAERARARRAGFALTAENVGIAAEICRRLEGLPLAIELAAARVNVLGLRGILAAVERRFALLAEEPRPASEAHGYLGALVAWSYDLLHADEKTMLHQLAVFRGGASLPALVGVAAAARQDLDAAAVTHMLGKLVDKSIVDASFPDDEPLYNLLETVREYVLERLVESGGLAATRMAHAEYFAAIADDAAVGLRGREHLSWERRLSREGDNLWAALEYARDAGDPDVAVRLGAGLGWFFAVADRISEGRSFLELALGAASEDAAAEQRIELLAFFCYLATEERDLGAALEAGERGLALARTVAAPQATALVQAAHAFALAVSGESERAAAQIEESRTGFDAVGDHWGVAGCGLVTAIGALRAGDVDTVASLTSEILRCSEAIEYEPFQVWGILLEAWVSEVRNEPAAATVAYRRALEVAERAGLEHDVSFALTGLGSCALAGGDVRRAREFQRRAVATAEGTGASWFVAHARVQLARALEAAGEPDTAERLYREVVDWSELKRLHQAQETLPAALAGSPGAAALLGLAELAASRDAAAADELRARAAARAELDLDLALLERIRGMPATVGA